MSEDYQFPQQNQIVRNPTTGTAANLRVIGNIECGGDIFVKGHVFADNRKAQEEYIIDVLFLRLIKYLGISKSELDINRILKSMGYHVDDTQAIEHLKKIIKQVFVNENSASR